MGNELARVFHVVCVIIAIAAAIWGVVLFIRHAPGIEIIAVVVLGMLWRQLA